MAQHAWRVQAGRLAFPSSLPVTHIHTHHSPQVGRWYSAPGVSKQEGSPALEEEQEGGGGVGKYLSKVLAGPSKWVAF